MAARSRGFTLEELAVYGSLCLFALALLVTLVVEVRRSFGQTTTAYLVDRAFDRAVAQLQQDLVETSLGSVRVFPGETGSGYDQEPPGISLASARSQPGGERLELSHEGTPSWRGHVFYTLVPDGQSGTGRLVRWVKGWSRPGGPPVASRVLPSAVGTSSQAVVAEGVVLPGAAMAGSGESAGPRGGIQVLFLRRLEGKDSLSSVNPSEMLRDPSGHGGDGGTGLLDVELRMVRASEGSQPQFAAVRFRLAPRY